MEDRELQKRIDAQRFPTIDGVLDKMERTDSDGTYRVSGDITFRGVSRRHEDLMTIEAASTTTRSSWAARPASTSANSGWNRRMC